MAIQFFKQTTVPQAQSPDGIYYVQTSQHEPFRLFVVHAGEVVEMDAATKAELTQKVSAAGDQMSGQLEVSRQQTGDITNISELFLLLKSYMSSGSKGEIAIGFGQTNQADTYGGKIAFKTTGSYSRGDLVFSVKNTINNGTPNIDALFIKSNGNIGIGEDNPTHLLDVGGNVRIKTVLVSEDTIVTINESGELTKSQLSTDEIVKTGGNQEIFGHKEFATVPSSQQDASSSNDLVRKSQMDTAVNSKANDNIVVKTINNQTVNGKKTFTTVPATHQAPSTGFDLANKDYVDSIGTPGLDDVLSENNQTDGHIEIVSDINNPTQNPRMFIGVDSITVLNTNKNFIIQSASSNNYATIGLAGSTNGGFVFHQSESTAKAGISTDNRIKAAPAINSDELMTLGQAAQSALITELDQIGFFNLSSNNATIGTVIFTNDSPPNGYYELTLSGGIPGRIYTFIFTLYDGQVNQDIYLSNGTVHNQFEPFPPGTVLKLQYDQTNQKWWEIGGWTP